MKIDLKEVKAGLAEIKTELMAKAKDGMATSDDLTEFGKKMDEKIENQMKEVMKRKASLPGLEGKEKKAFSFGKCIKAQVDGWAKVKNSGYEQEVIEALAVVKSQNGSSGEAGGFFIPEEFTSEVIDLAIAKTPVMEMGVTQLRNLRGELPIPKSTGRNTMYWVGEEEASTESSSTFGEIVLRPKTAAAFTKISRRLLHQSGNVVENIVKGNIIDAFALGFDRAFLTGAGNSKVPAGIDSFTGLTATTDVHANGGRFTIDKASEMAMNIDVANMLKGNLGYIMRPEVLSLMLRERVPNFSGQTDGQPINPMAVIMSPAQLESVLGYKVRTTTLLDGDIVQGDAENSSRVYFGDWSQFVVGFWEGFELKASDSAGDASGSAFTQRQIWLSAFQGVDSNIKDETGFTTVDGATIDGLVGT